MKSSTILFAFSDRSNLFQAKRVNIGIALVSTPRVLFLDEPTSGLDSFTANEVMTVVKNLTDDGTTICTTIHSPTPYVYGLFDTMMILVRGQTAYFGSRGEKRMPYDIGIHRHFLAEHAIGYFESLTNTTRQVNENSEAEWITDIVVSIGRQRNHQDMLNAYNTSALKKSIESEIDGRLDEKGIISEDEYREISVKRETVTPFWFGFKTFLKV